MTSANQRIWDRYLTDDDRAIYEEAGYGRLGGAGSNPALLVVDVTYQFVGDKPEPVRESIKRFPDSCGLVGWRAMDRIGDLLAVFRETGQPIFYTRAMDNPDALTAGSWSWKKSPDSLSAVATSDVNEIPAQIAPGEGERVIPKTKPSAFFGTALQSYLVYLGIDTLVVSGTTTSGCVRATVLDSFSSNYRTLVAEDAVFDRIEASHVMSCFDMHAKYADVMVTSDIIDYVRACSS